MDAPTPHLGASFPPVTAGLAPSLCVLKQNSLSEEKFTRGGKPHKVHVVVKNSPFVVSLATAASNKPFGPLDMMSLAKYFTNGELDLGKLTFDCKLLYDTENGSEKEVDYVENKPFQFKVNVVNGGRQVDIEVRLKVLSSQHEDMFFVVKFMALDPLTKREVSPYLVVHSLPIKVISKPEQLKKRRPSKKRTLNDMLIEALTRIEQNQQSQQQLLDQLAEGTGITVEIEDEEDEDSGDGEGSDGDEGEGFFSQGSGGEQLSAHQQQQQLHQQLQQQHHQQLLMQQQQQQQQPFMGHQQLPPHMQQQQQQPAQQAASAPASAVDPAMEFEEALDTLLQKYSAVPDSEREAKIQKVLLQSPLSRENLVELYDLFVSEGLQPPPGTDMMEGEGSGVPVSGECACPSCPHRAELERIEVFYRDVFHL